MKLQIWFDENETACDTNNFTIANAINKLCIENNRSIGYCKQEPDYLDVEIIAKMLLLQCKKFGEVEDNGN